MRNDLIVVGWDEPSIADDLTDVSSGNSTWRPFRQRIIGIYLASRRQDKTGTTEMQVIHVQSDDIDSLTGRRFATLHSSVTCPIKDCDPCCAIARCASKCFNNEREKTHRRHPRSLRWRYRQENCAQNQSRSHIPLAFLTVVVVSVNSFQHAHWSDCS